jgi:hypothetical protein
MHSPGEIGEVYQKFGLSEVDLKDLTPYLTPEEMIANKEVVARQLEMWKRLEDVANDLIPRYMISPKITPKDGPPSDASKGIINIVDLDTTDKLTVLMQILSVVAKIVPRSEKFFRGEGDAPDSRDSPQTDNDAGRPIE